MGLLLDKGKARLAFTLSILSTVLYWGSVSVFGNDLSLRTTGSINLTSLQGLSEYFLSGASISRLSFSS